MHSIYYRKLKLISILLAALMLLALLPAGTVEAREADIFKSITYSYISGGNENTISMPATGIGVRYDLTSINFPFDSDYSVSSKESLEDIRVYVNGRYDETDRFQIVCENNVLKFKVRNSPLRKHALYSIYIPENTFSNDGSRSNSLKHTSFVTGTDEIFPDGTGKNGNIIRNITPYNSAHNVDYREGRIVIEFVDDIDVNPEVFDDPEDYIQVRSSPLDSDIPEYYDSYPYDTNADIDGFDIYSEDNKLILESKSGSFKDFAIYSVTLKRSDVVFLRNSYLSDEEDEIIHNQAKSFTFYTDNMLDGTSPENNEENVEIKPLIEFEFKHEVDIINKNNITINEGERELSAEDYNIYLSEVSGYDGTVLTLNIDDHQGNRVYPFRRNTMYKITLKHGAVRFADYSVVNREIQLVFTTGGDGKSPVVTGYSSNPENTDDIRYLDHEDKEEILPSDKVTDLDSDGSIYIHFDMPVRGDRETELLSLLEAAHLYKVPKSDSVIYDEDGKMGDEIMSYKPYNYTDEDGDLQTTIIPGSISDTSGIEFGDWTEHSLHEIKIGEVEIVSEDILRVTPEHPLDSLSKYKLTIDRRTLEDYNGYNLEEDIDFMFWTKADDSDTPAQWERPDEISARSILEGEKMPYKSYTLFGVPRYSESLPIILDIDQEVIIKPKDMILKQTPVDRTDERMMTYDSLKEITLEDVYNRGAISEKSVPIQKYELRYHEEDGIRKTRLYLYTEKTPLDYGKHYSLRIPEGVLATRSGNDVPRLELNFVTESDISKPFSIYQLDNNSARLTEVWEKGEWSFRLLGSNFHEYVQNMNYSIKRVELYDESKDRTITIGQRDIEFINSTEMLIKIKGANAEYFSQETYTGQYQIRVVYTDDEAAGTDERTAILSTGSWVDQDIVVDGQDFRTDIKSVTVENIGTNELIVLQPEDVRYESSSRVILKVRGSNAVTASSWGASASYDVRVEYEKKLDLDDLTAGWEYEIFGSGFNNPVYQIVFRPVLGKAFQLPADERDIVIEQDFIHVDSDTMLTVEFDHDALDKLNDPERAGTYQIIVKYAEGLGIYDMTSAATMLLDDNMVTINEKVDITDSLIGSSTVTIPDRFIFELLSKGKPEIKAQNPFPVGSGKWSDEKSLVHDVEDLFTIDKYFIRITFEDVDGSLKFDYQRGLSLLKDSASVLGQGSANSMINSDFLTSILNMTESERIKAIDKYIFVKNREKREAYLFIPVRPLQAQMPYDASIPGGIVYYQDVTGGFSNGILWRFVTMARPQVSKIGVGSLREDYDNKQPVIINGIFFYGSSVKVLFNKIEADRVVVKVDSSGLQFLEAYLPGGKDRLTPGLYDITVQNDDNHEQTTYGALSIVKDGGQMPDEKTRLKGNTANGQVFSDYRLSADTLELDIEDAGSEDISLHLDEIMGEDVWVRKIKFIGSAMETIDRLETLSKWGDTVLYGVTLESQAADGDSIIKLGRAEETLTQSIKQKLGKKMVKSDFIQVTGTGFSFQKVDIKLPYKNSSGMNLRVMRYNEGSRSWTEESCMVNETERVVSLSVNKTGIFVAVE